MDMIRYTGTSVSKATRHRLPREERLKEFKNVIWLRIRGELKMAELESFGVPVAVEVSDSAEYLDEFVHPEYAMYIFGPEDGSIPKAMLAECHRFVRIRSANRTPLNLAAAVNTVLHDRLIKEPILA
jgi:hypothetical protein